MTSVRTNAAAALLGVSANTLRSWERRFGFPEPRRTEGGHRQFALEEIEALRTAFGEVPDVASAIELARRRGTGPAIDVRLRTALVRFDDAEADRIAEESLAVRSLERTVDEVLLPAVAGVERACGTASPELGLAWRWATGWLAAATRAAPPAAPGPGVLVFEATAPPDLDALHAQALELLLRRRGVRVLSIAVAADAERLPRAIRALRPRCVVVCGRRAPLEEVGRVVYAARREAGGAVPVWDFRGGLGGRVERLPPGPLAAAARLVG